MYIFASPNKEPGYEVVKHNFLFVMVEKQNLFV